MQACLSCMRSRSSRPFLHRQLSEIIKQSDVYKREWWCLSGLCRDEQRRRRVDTAGTRLGRPPQTWTPRQGLGSPLPPPPSTRCPAGCLFLDEDARMSQVCDSFTLFYQKKKKKKKSNLHVVCTCTGRLSFLVLTSCLLIIFHFESQPA